jgi:eukaryotic-like serine/threonine-protein kinase
VTLEAGRRLGPYAILAPIGAGGMGEVYEARDTRLGRTVAIKVLPEGLAESPELRARFEREARAVSQLSHPHVCALHDVGEEQGIHFLVLEHCEGETLGQRLTRGPLSLEDTLRYGAQIAEALGAAHHRAIVHRDLKPANVMLTASGVKLLDFGLARLAAEAEGPVADLPTVTLEAGRTITRKGTLLGTFPYMSPEQVEGGAADARSDIFSLGAVLYEMATGRPAFQGGSAGSVMAAVLKEEPEPLSRVRPGTPPALEHVVSRCLAKNPEERWQSARDVAVELRWAAETGSRAGVAAAPAERSTSRERLAWALFALAVLAAAGLAARWLLGTSPEESPAPRPVRFTVEPPEGITSMADPIHAEDGSFLVYRGGSEEGDTRLYVRSFDQLESIPLPGTEGTRSHFVSPDGRWIGFQVRGALHRVPRAGGDVLTVLADGAHGPGALWDRQGAIVFSTAWLGGLAEVPVEGGEPRQLTTPDAKREEIGHWWPRLLPNGRDVLFTVFRAATGVNDARIAVLDRDSGQVRTLLPGAQALYVPSGHLLYYRAGAYHAVGFDPESLEVRGDPVRLDGSWKEIHPAGADGHWVTVSPDGTLAFVPGRLFAQSSLVWVDPGGEPDPVLAASRSYGREVEISPDGSRAALVALERGWFRMMIVDLERGIEEMLLLDGNAEEPAWHPDGRRFAWESMRRGNFDIHWKDLQAGGPEEPLLATDGDEWPETFTRDGSSLLLRRSLPDGQYHLSLLELEAGGEPRSLFPLGEEVALSPGDRWIAYEADGVFVRPFLREGAAIRISRDRGQNPRWGNDGKTLYYERGDEIVAVPYREEEGGFVPGEERTVATVPGLWDFDLAPDGRFLALVRTDPEARPRIQVVLGWDRELARAAITR